MVFPLSDDNSDRTTLPIVTVLLIIMNILVFVFAQQLGDNDQFTMAYSTVPAEIVSGKDIVTDVRVVDVQTENGTQQVEVPGLQRTPIPVYLTLLTSMFMHGSFGHLFGNMWFLWIFGDNIEHDLGKVRYAIFYVLCGILASLVHVFFNQDSSSALIPCLGASGAISGIMGGYLLLHSHRTVTVLLLRFVTNVPGYVAVGLWFVFQIFSSLSGMEAGVAHGAHIGGFIAGAVLAKPFTFGRTLNAAT
jgi:membrane associated rhomboid family serine protease